MNNTNKQLAEKAYQLGETAFENGDYELARIYILNAITHDDDLKYFCGLINIVKKTSPNSRKREVAEEALNLLSMALLQGDPDRIGTIQSKIGDLQTVFDDTFDSATVSSDSEAHVPNFADLERYSWTTMKKAKTAEDMPSLQEKSEFLQQILNSSGISEALRGKAEQEFRTCVSLIEFLSKKKALEETISEIKKESVSSKNVYFLAAKLQNASNILAQMWLLDVSPVIPNSECRQTLSKFTEEIKKQEDNYNRLRSEPLYKELRNKISKTKTDILSSTITGTQKLGIIQKTVQEVSERVFELSAPDYVQDIQKSLRDDLGKRAEDIAKKRFAEYQKKVADLCYGAIKQYKDANWVNESDAEEYLGRYRIAEIDESLLSPEASAIFHEAKGLLVDKFSKEKKASFQVKCVTGKKMKLEDF